MSKELKTTKRQRTENKERRAIKLCTPNPKFQPGSVPFRSLPFLKLLVILIISLSLFCAINPVTGEKEFMLVSEEQEFALGKVFSGKAFHAEVLKNVPS
jgi:hypothetical protein